MSRDVALKYVGDGSYVHPVPARDLTEEEALKHRNTINANKRATGRALYEAVYIEESEDEE